MTPHREMQLWVGSANPDYQKAVEERLAELRVKGEEAKRERRFAFGAKRRPPTNYAGKMSLNNFKRDLFDGLLSVIPREKTEPVLRAEPPKETGHLSDSEIWNGYEWERD
tara:strand:+ start:691 stop:1020 length:330 start_codon:yes stop_codon:yes gene_type:complete